MPKRDEPRRDPYADVGIATRAVIERALAEGAPLRAWRVLAAVLHQTSSFSWLERRISRAKLGELTGMCEDDVKRGVRWLREHEVLDIRKGYTATDGTRVVTIFRLPSPGCDSRPPQGVNLAPPQGGESNGNRGANRTERGGQSAPRYEDHSRIIETTPPAEASDGVVSYEPVRMPAFVREALR